MKLIQKIGCVFTTRSGEKRKFNGLKVVALITAVCLMMTVVSGISSLSGRSNAYAAESVSLDELAENKEEVRENGIDDALIYLPFDGDVNNKGSSEAQPAIVGQLQDFSNGFRGRALYFDTEYNKVSENNPAPYVDLGTHEDLQFKEDTDFSVSFWIKFPSLTKTSGWPAIISNKKMKQDIGWQLITDEYENLRWQMTIGGESPHEFEEVTFYRATDTDWHHIVLSHDRDGFAKFYVDGQEITNKTVDLSAYQGTVDTNFSTKIGVTGTGGLANVTRDKLNISLDDMRIYNRALTAEDVAALMQIEQSFTTRIMLERVTELGVDTEAKSDLYAMKHGKIIVAVEEGVEYKSSNEQVATIDANGIIHGIAVGETTISASFEGFQDSYQLTVKEQLDGPEWRSQLRQEHPRLMATAADFVALRAKIESDEVAATWFENIEQQAEQLMSSSTYNGEDPQRILLLGMMYQLTGESAYVERAWDELKILFDRPLWDPDMFLELSARSMSAAFAYDWFYDAWTEAQLDQLRKNIIEKGLMPGVLTYRLGADAPYNTNYWYGKVNPDANNWNTVSNAALLIGALALGDEIPYLAEEIMSNGLSDIEYSLQKFSPHGGWFEGYAYWNYTWIYLVRLLGSLDTALGEENNSLFSYSGLSESGDFPIYLTGATTKAFNFGDSGTGIGDNEQMYYLANRYNKPQYTQYQLSFTDKVAAIDPLSLLWYNPEHRGGTEYSSMPLDKSYADIEIGALRQSWQNTNGISVMFKAGAAQNGHMDLDAGTFVLDALGERWFSDLGDRNRAEWPNFFSTYGPRWTYYTKRAEGHNTLVINPKPATGSEGSPDQTFVYNGDYRLYNAPIEILQSYEKQAFSIMDLTKAYRDKGVSSVRRGIALLNDRQQVLLQDEIKLQKPGELYSFLHMNGKATASLADDGQSAMLTIDNKRLWISLLDAEEGDELIIMKAEPLTTSPNPSIQYTKPGVIDSETPKQKLAVHLQNRQESQINLLIVPLSEGENIPSAEQFPALGELSDWTELYKEATVTPNPNPSLVPPAYVGDPAIEDGRASSANSLVEVTKEQVVISGSKAMITVPRTVEEVRLPADVVAFIGDNELEINSNEWAMTIPSTVLSEAGEGNDMAIKVTKWNKAEVERAIANMAASTGANVKLASDIFAIELTIGERSLHVDEPISVTIKAMEGMDLPQASVYYMTANGELEYVGGQSEDGKWTFFINQGGQYAVMSISKALVDVDNNYWAANIIDQLVSRLVMNGVSDTEFAPNRKLTRAEFTALIVRAFKLKDKADLPFIDIKADDWFVEEVSIGYKAGIINGKSADHFDPNGMITREEMVVMMMRAYRMTNDHDELENASEVVWTDSDKMEEWAREDIITAAKLGLIHGRPNGAFDPKGTATRAEAAKVIYQLLAR